MGEFDRALAGARDAPALIINVRDDNGGDTAVMPAIRRAGFRCHRLYALIAPPRGSASYRWPENIDPRGPWRYGGKVIILVDRWSESVAEGFAMALHEARDATVHDPDGWARRSGYQSSSAADNLDAQISAETVCRRDWKSAFRVQAGRACRSRNGFGGRSD